jgi:hypothetical protein
MDLIVPDIFQSLARFLATPPRATLRRFAPAHAVSLPMNGNIDLEQAYGCRIHCVRGSIWITHLGDGRDLVVEAGSSFVGDRETPMWIQALLPAEFTLERLL